jgi:hypothetical protein
LIRKLKKKKEKRKKKKEKRILCFVDASFLLSFSWLDISAYISIHAIDHVFSFAK